MVHSINPTRQCIKYKQIADYFTDLRDREALFKED